MIWVCLKVDMSYMVLDHIIDGSGHDGGVISTSFASAPRQGTGKSRENRLETSGNVGNHGFSPMKYSVYGFREIYGDIWKMMENDGNIGNHENVKIHVFRNFHSFPSNDFRDTIHDQALQQTVEIC